MAKYSFDGKDYYIDGRLKEQLDKKVLPELKKKDKDVVFIIDGREGSGKSKFADLLGGYAASYFKTNFNLNNFAMTPDEFRNLIRESPKNSVVIYDEAHRGMSSRRALSEINNILVDLMMEMRQKNLFVLIVLPTIFMLDRYPALFRSRGLFHIYERERNRGFWVFYNEKNKQKLYMAGKKLFDYNCIPFPKFRGRFTNQYVVNEIEYRIKKEKAFRDKPRITQQEKFKAQRDLLIGLLKDKLEITTKELHEILNNRGLLLDEDTLGGILAQEAPKQALKGKNPA